MAAPNIVNVTQIIGKTAVQNVITSATTIVSNGVSSNKIYKLNALYISNVDGVANGSINVDLYRDSNVFHLAKTVTVPADSSIDVLSKALYLEEGDALRLTASANNTIEAVCSYEEIS